MSSVNPSAIKKFQCHICGKEYTKQFNFNYHVAHHSDARPFACDFPECTNAYKTKADLRQHQKIHEKSLGMVFICFKCNLTFETSTKLNIHKKEIHNSKSESASWCELCNRNFTSLRSHIDIVHRKIRPFVCDLDGKRFGKMHGLIRHIDSVHLGLKPYQCVECLKEFKEFGALKKHAKIHTRGRKKYERVKKVQPAVSSWSDDEEIVKEKIRYNCGSCLKSFLSMASMLKHEKRTHSDAKFTCDVCARGFVTKKSIRLHMLTIHDLKQDGSSLVNSKAYKCGICKKIISTKNGFERHKRVLHFENQEFLCEHCSAGFNDRAALNKHLIKNHNQDMSGKGSLSCLSCLKTFRTNYNLEKHEILCRLKRQQVLNQELDKKIDQKNEVLINQDDQNSCEAISDKEPEDQNDQEGFLDPFEIKSEDILTDSEQMQPPKEEPLSEPDDLSDSDSATIKCEIKEESISSFASKEIRLRPKRLRKSVIKFEKSIRNPKKSLQENVKNDIKVEETDGEPEIEEKLLKEMFTGETFKHFEKLFECKICLKSFEKLAELKLHCVVSHRIKKFKCTLCNHSFNSRNQFRIHWTKNHQKTVYSQSLFKRSYAIPNENHTCPHCFKVLSQKESLKRHFELVHDANRPTFYCDQCATSFKDPRTLKFHLLKQHSENVEEKIAVRRRKTTKEITCDCGEVVYGKTGLLIHQWNKHYNIKIKDKHKYHCLICKEVMNCRATALRHHRQVHNEGRILIRTCQECNAQFQFYEDFKQHIEIDHENDRICLICGLKSRSAAEFISHMKAHRTVPESEKKLVCDLCGFRAQQKATIELHMVRAHNGKKKEYFSCCEFCGAFFSCYQTFHSHRKNSCRNSRRKDKSFGGHKCSWCERRFYNSRDLKDHETSHTSEARPYQCEVPGCSKEYVSFSSFRWHVKNSHNKTRNQCKICRAILSSREKLIAHTDELHKELRKFSCQFCAKSFTTHLANSKHMKNCEPSTVD